MIFSFCSNLEISSSCVRNTFDPRIFCRDIAEDEPCEVPGVIPKVKKYAKLVDLEKCFKRAESRIRGVDLAKYEPAKVSLDE